MGWSSRPASSVAGSTDHKDDRECQWQANGESPGNRQAECRKQIYLRAQPINRHAVFSDAGEQTADAVTASARRHLSWVQERVRRNSYREVDDRSGAFWRGELSCVLLLRLGAVPADARAREVLLGRLEFDRPDLTLLVLQSLSHPVHEMQSSADRASHRIIV
jgi:hypothetical protein